MSFKDLELQDQARAVVRRHVKEHLEKTDLVPQFDTYVVWWSKTLQNWKALISTTLPDGKYYEVTFDGDKYMIYLDTYVKLENKVYDAAEMD